MAKKKNTIKYKGKEYEVVFNLNVMEIIQDEYGTLDAWVNESEADEPKAKAVKFGLGAMINEGIDMYNEDHEDKREFFNDKQIGRILTELGLKEAGETLKKAVIESAGSDEKNS